MTTERKANLLISGYKNFCDQIDKSLLKNPQSKIRFVITSANHNATDNTIMVQSTEKINIIIDLFTKELQLRTMDYMIEDFRFEILTTSYMFIQFLKIEVFNI